MSREGRGKNQRRMSVGIVEGSVGKEVSGFRGPLNRDEAKNRR